jgi:predicted MPP superfamily phosphohydrolase
VSRGAGVYQLPLRFFAPPEIHLIELRRGEPAGVKR